MTKPVNGPITAEFNQPRPLGAEEPDHIHGAIDIGGYVGSPVLAPEDGKLMAYLAIRYGDAVYWPDLPELNGERFPFGNYFYDMFGGIFVLKAEDRTHILSHFYGNQLFNAGFFGSSDLIWEEEARATRWPIHAVHTKEVWVGEGQELTGVGNAGTSTGAHVHWEIHIARGWTPHFDRIDPVEWLNS